MNQIITLIKKEEDKIIKIMVKENKIVKEEKRIIVFFIFFKIFNLEKNKNIFNEKCVSCHKCKRVNYEKNVLTCKSYICLQSFCERCIKSYVT